VRKLTKIHTLALALVLVLQPAFAQPTPVVLAYDPATADAEMMPIKQMMQALYTDIVKTGTGAVAIGERGHILYSSNMQEWIQIPSPTRSLLTNAFALDSHVWAVGHEQVILHSSDGGSTWTRQYLKLDAFGPLLDILFLDDQRGFAIGVEGTILKSSDGGSSWTEAVITDLTTESASPATSVAVDDEAIDSGVASDDMGVDETPPHLNAITRSPLGLMIVGENGAVFSSTDEGSSWVRKSLPYNGSMFGVVTLDDGSLAAFGLNGNVFHTKDLGDSWEKLISDTDASIMGAAAATGGRAVFVGARGVVLTKGADTTQLAKFVFQDGGSLAGVLPISDDEFVVVGENGIKTFKPERK
jgi:photosystem II stability/assembly factor-like uncharacterized protein